MANFEVRCCASQRLHQARRGVYSCVQGAAAARVAGGRDIWESVLNADGASVLCYVIADADAVNKRNGGSCDGAQYKASIGKHETTSNQYIRNYKVNNLMEWEGCLWPLATHRCVYVRASSRKRVYEPVETGFTVSADPRDGV